MTISAKGRYGVKAMLIWPYIPMKTVFQQRVLLKDRAYRKNTLNKFYRSLEGLA